MTSAKGFLQVDGEYLRSRDGVSRGLMTNLVSSLAVSSHWLSRARNYLCKHQQKLRQDAGSYTELSIASSYI